MCNLWNLEFVRHCSQYWQPDSCILDVGSRNVNGSAHDVLTDHTGTYIGVDIEAGPGVDMILDVKDLVEAFGAGSFDAVISTGAIEHMADWRVAVYQMSAVLRVGGVLCLTTCMPGFEYHPYPIDAWRFRKEQLEAIFQPPMDAEFVWICPDVSRGKSVEVAIMAKRTDADLDQWHKRLYTLTVDTPK